MRDPLLKLVGNTSGPLPICKPLLLCFDTDEDNEDNIDEGKDEVTDEETISGRAADVTAVGVTGDVTAVVVVRIRCLSDPSLPDGTLNFLSL